MGGLIVWFDGDVLAGGLWALAGTIVGTWGYRFLHLQLEFFLEWYQDRWQNAELERRTFSLLRLNQRNGGEEWSDSGEYKRWTAHESFIAALPLAPLFGIFHGTLLGPIAGCFGPVDGFWYWPVSARLGAAIGLCVTPVLLSATAAAVMAIMVPERNRQINPQCAAQRLQLLVSPIFVVPAALHSLWKTVQVLTRGARSWT